MSTFTKTKRTFKKKPMRSLSVMTLQREISSLKRNMPRQELKFIDTILNSTQLSNTTGYLDLLTGVAQGSDLINRIGNSINYKSISVEGFVNLSSLNTNNFDLVKISLVLDRQANGSSPAWTDIYGSGAAPFSLAQRNKQTVDRYKVLKEWKLDLDTNGRTMVKFSAYIKFPYNKDYTQKFNGTGATIASIESNPIYLVYEGAQTTATFPSYINYYTRVRFADA